MKNHGIRIWLLLVLITIQLQASATERGELSNFTGLIVVATNHIKGKDIRGCSVDEGLIAGKLKHVTSGKPFRISPDISDVGHRFGFLSIRLEGFDLGDSCVLHLLFQVKAAVDILHNGKRTEAALSSRSTIGMIKKAEASSEIVNIVTIWSNELVQDWARDNNQKR
jgi:hypothetical protein